MEPADRLPHGASGHRGGRARDEFHLCGQRSAGLRQGGQLDPGRRVPAPGQPVALRRPARAGRGGGSQPPARLGRRDLRGRRLLRRVRRARPDGLAGLPVRLRGLQRGGAAALGGHRRGARQRDPPDDPPEPGAVERLQREHLGPRGLGLEVPPGRQVVGLGLLHRRPARDRRRARPRPALLGRQSLVTDCWQSPERSAARHRAHLGRLEPARLHGLPRLHAAVRRRVRLAGSADLVDAAPLGVRRPADPRVARACSCTRRPRRATAS